MKISNELYTLAKDYYKSHLWKKLWDSEIFAVKFDDGKIGYISIMGRLGVTNCLGIYIGSEALQTFFNFSHSKGEEDPLQMFETGLKQDTLQLNFDAYEDIPEYFLDDIYPINGHSIKGPIAWFIKYIPGKMARPISEEQDLNYMEQAVKAALFVSEELKHNSVRGLGFVDVFESFDKGIIDIDIPLVEKVNGKFSLSKIALPPEEKEKFEPLEYSNQVQLSKLNNIRPRESYQATIFYSPTPVLDEDISPDPIYLQILIMVNETTQLILRPVIITGSEEDDYEEGLNEIVNLWINDKIHPKRITVNNEKTYYFFSDLAKLANIKLELNEDAELIKEVSQDFNTTFSAPTEDEEKLLMQIHDSIGDLNTASEEDIANATVDVILSKINEEFDGALDEDELNELKAFVKSDMPTFLDGTINEFADYLRTIDQLSTSPFEEEIVLDNQPENREVLEGPLSFEDLEEMLGFLVNVAGLTPEEIDQVIKDLERDGHISFEILEENELNLFPEELDSFPSFEDLREEIFQAKLQDFIDDLDDFPTFSFPYVDDNEDIEENSYVFSISPKPGLYRHIQISSKATLEELETAILEAFDIRKEAEEYGAFLMDSKDYINFDSRILGAMNSDLINESDFFPKAKDFELDGFDFDKGQTFLYDFLKEDEEDFIEMKVKFLREVNEITEKPKVIRKKG